jgi:hypothetical protein
MAGTRTQTMTVADSGTVSTSFAATEFAAYGLVVPSTFDGTAITFQASADNAVNVPEASATYQALYEYDPVANDGSMRVATITGMAASRSYDLPVALVSWPRWKIVCGTAQTGATVFTVVGKAP